MGNVMMPSICFYESMIYVYVEDGWGLTINSHLQPDNPKAPSKDECIDRKSVV